MTDQIIGRVDDALQHHNREAGRRRNLGDFTVEVASLQDWSIVTDWGNGEMWNIGFHDAECFFTVDPEGFFLARSDGEPVSAVSLVNYDDSFAVWGHYLVAPEHRGKGFGIEVCKVASRHSGDRTTAGDGMPEQVENYSKDGSVPIHRTIHRWGDLQHPDRVETRAEAVTEADLDAIAAYDAECFPAERRSFLAKWLFIGDHRAVCVRDGGRITGYAVVRPAPVGYRIGPVVADDTATARHLLVALTADLPAGVKVSAFAPDLNPDAAGLFAEFGMAEHFHVVRMWRGPRPERAHDQMFAIASLELG